jgi:hypothetical protein
MVITVKNVNNNINSADAKFGSIPKAIIKFCKFFIAILIILLPIFKNLVDIQC